MTSYPIYSRIFADKPEFGEFDPEKRWAADTGGRRIANVHHPVPKATANPYTFRTASERISLPLDILFGKIAAVEARNTILASRG